MNKKLNIILRIALVVVVLFFSYLRHTYIINPNLSGEPWLVSVYNRYLLSTTMSLFSMLIYFTIFGLLTWWLAAVYFPGKKSLVISIYIFLAAISAVAFFLFKVTNAEVLFNAGSALKNFLLSPLYGLIVYLWLSYVEKKRQ